MTKATSAKGVQLAIQKDGSTWTVFSEVKSVPEIGQSAEKIDVTSLTSEMKEYVSDIPDFSADLEFTLNSIPHGEQDSTFDILEELDQDKVYKWKITYPQQKIQCELNGRFVWKMGAAEVSAAQDLVLTIIPASAPTWSEYTAVVNLSYAEEGQGVVA